MARVPRLVPRVGLCSAVILVVAVAAGCGKKPSRLGKPDQAVPPSVSGTDQSVDKQIAEALAKVDPSLLHERAPIPEEQNAFPLWAEAMEKLVPIEGAEEHARRLRRWREEFGDKLAEVYGREVKPGPGLLGYSAERNWGMGPTDLEKAFKDILYRADRAPAGEIGGRFSEWLDRNREVFDLIDAGISRGKCRLPQIDRPGLDMYNIPTLQHISLIRRARAKMLAWAGEFDAAADELVSVQRMGELISEAEGGINGFQSLTYFLVMGTTTVRWLAGRADVPEDALERLMAGLPPLSRLGEAFAQSLRINLTNTWIPSIREMLEKADDPELRRSLPDETGKWGLDFSGEAGEAFARDFETVQLNVIDPAETLDMMSRYYMKFVKNATGSWKARIKGLDAELKRWRKGWEAPYKDALRAVKQALADNRAVTEGEMARFVETLDNAMGRYLLALDLPTMNSSVWYCFSLRADREGTRAVVALRLYEIRHGGLPASLAELLEDGILKAVPSDPFSGGELLYSRERRVVWSVGPDEEDDGGAPGDADTPPARRKDEVWRIPVSR